MFKQSLMENIDNGKSWKNSLKLYFERQVSDVPACGMQARDVYVLK